jgi:hypothetical protein
MAPKRNHFLHCEKFPPVFRKGSVVILGNTYDTDSSDSITTEGQTRCSNCLYLLYAIQIFTIAAAIDHFYFSNNPGNVENVEKCLVLKKYENEQK